MAVAADATTRPPCRYHGSKHTLGPKIIPRLPVDHDLYSESHAGMFNVLLLKKRSPIEVANDLSGDVVNFFRVLRDSPDEFIRRVTLTPFALEEWRLSYEPTDDPIERARRFYGRAYMSIAGPTSSLTNPGFRRQKKLSRSRNGRSTMTAAAKTFADVEHLWTIADRLRGVTIECEDALVHMKRYDSPRTLFYVDPPYYPSTRVFGARNAYEHEMDEAAHETLLTTLNRLKAMVALSGYRCELYDDMLTEWTRTDWTVRVNGDGSAVESLWLNPAAEEALRRPPPSDELPLFASATPRRMP